MGETGLKVVTRSVSVRGHLHAGGRAASRSGRRSALLGKLVVLGCCLMILGGCFGPGTRFVGTGDGEVAPGLYTTQGADFDDLCYWERTAANGDIIDNGLPDGRAFMVVSKTDHSIETSGSCVWVEAPNRPLDAAANGDGVARVGLEIQPGKYKAPGGPGCYWARLSSLDGSGFDSIVDNHFGAGPQSVEIASTDAAFESSDCGVWHRTQ